MRSILRAVSLLALLFSMAWVAYKPGFDSALAAIGALAALISSFLMKKNSSTKVTQSQEISSGSIGIQAGRDANVSKIER